MYTIYWLGALSLQSVNQFYIFKIATVVHSDHVVGFPFLFGSSFAFLQVHNLSPCIFLLYSCCSSSACLAIGSATCAAISQKLLDWICKKN